MRTPEHTSKEAFLSTWPGGYEENFEVYTPKTGLTEAEIVDTCLKPFYDLYSVALEIGCGKGFWTRRHLLPNFRIVIGVDVIPEEWIDAGTIGNFYYYQAGDNSYDLPWIDYSSIDFVWSFGVFCHLPNEASGEYCHSIFRVLKPGGVAVLYFSNTARRPSRTGAEFDGDSTTVGWAENNWKRTRSMLVKCGFVNVRECIPGSMDTFAFAKKPEAI